MPSPSSASSSVWWSRTQAPASLPRWPTGLRCRFPGVDRRGRAQIGRARGGGPRRTSHAGGTGQRSQVALLIRELGRRRRDGLRFRCVAASAESAALARAQGLELDELAPGGLDLALDGADEVDPQRRLLKGGGGALTRERIVLEAARRRVILVDSRKLVDRLGHRAELPLEILSFGAARTRELVACVLGRATLRRRGRAPFVSDNGGLILDGPLAPGHDLARLQRELERLPGVVDTGLFLDLRPQILVGPSVPR
ncbi:MAG: ribose 5-phosphate isomerase A [Myxococcales bacterium]